MVDHTFQHRYLATYKWMVLGRVLEERIASLYRAGGKIVGGVYLGRGQEAFSAALGVSLNKGDVFGPLIRDMAGRLAFGEPLLDPVRTYLGSALGPMRGRDGNIHRGRPSDGMPAMISHLGSLVSVVSGMVMARRMQRKPACVGASSIGDGGTSTGAFHEAMNLAAVEKLPLVVAVANNQYAYSTPTKKQYACNNLVDRAIGYGVMGYSIDGTDLDACLTTFETAIDKARTGNGPQLVVGKLLRLGGHGEHDDGFYVDASLKQEPYGGDCVELARVNILTRGWASELELQAWQADSVREVQQSVQQAGKEPKPSATEMGWETLASSHLLEGGEA